MYCNDLSCTSKRFDLSENASHPHTQAELVTLAWGGLNSSRKRVWSGGLAPMRIYGEEWTQSERQGTHLGNISASPRAEPVAMSQLSWS